MFFVLWVEWQELFIIISNNQNNIYLYYNMPKNKPTDIVPYKSQNPTILTKYPELSSLSNFQSYLNSMRIKYVDSLKANGNNTLTTFKSELTDFFFKFDRALEDIKNGFERELNKRDEITKLISSMEAIKYITGQQRQMASNRLNFAGDTTKQRLHEQHYPYLFGQQPLLDPQQAQILQLQQQIQQLKEQSVPPAANAKTTPSLGGGYKNIQLFNIEFKKLLIKVDNINDNIKLSINEKKLRIKKLFNQFEKKIKTQVNKMKKETTNAIKLLKLTKLKKSKPKSRKKTVSKSKPKPRKKTVSKPKKNKVMN